MKKTLRFLMVTLFLVTAACSPFGKRDEQYVEEEDGVEHEVKVSPKVETKENYYRSVLYGGTYVHGEARGFSTDIVYNRLDLEHLELGLAEIAKTRFDPEKYFFREGQIIEKEELNRWLMRYDGTKDANGKEKNPIGLNPPLGKGATRKEQEENSPRFLSHILEHNYMVENKDGQLELAGIVLGVSLNYNYHFRIEDEEGRYYFYEVELDHEKAVEEGKKAAQKIVDRIRSEERENGKYRNVPIIVALFQEEKREAPIPGRFIATAVAEPNRPLEKWTAVNEKYYLFPSQEASNEQRNDMERFMKLQEEVNGFFDNYVGIVGTGYYYDGQLKWLKIEIPIRYYGKMEIIALAQFVADRIIQRFPENLQIQVYINSTGRNEALIVRNPNEEPFIHIYR